MDSNSFTRGGEYKTEKQKLQWLLERCTILLPPLCKIITSYALPSDRILLIFHIGRNFGSKNYSNKIMDHTYQLDLESLRQRNEVLDEYKNQETIDINLLKPINNFVDGESNGIYTDCVIMEKDHKWAYNFKTMTRYQLASTPSIDLLNRMSDATESDYGCKHFILCGRHYFFSTAIPHPDEVLGTELKHYDLGEDSIKDDSKIIINELDSGSQIKFIRNNDCSPYLYVESITNPELKESSIMTRQFIKCKSSFEQSSGWNLSTYRYEDNLYMKTIVCRDTLYVFVTEFSSENLLYTFILYEMTWMSLPPFQLDIQLMDLITAVDNANGKIYFVNGELKLDNKYYNGKNLCFNVKTKLWSTIKPSPVVRNISSAVVSDGKLYAFESCSPNAVIYCYDPARENSSNSWSTFKHISGLTHHILVRGCF